MDTATQVWGCLGVCVMGVFLLAGILGKPSRSNDQEKDTSDEHAILGQVSVLQEGAWSYARSNP